LCTTARYFRVIPCFCAQIAATQERAGGVLGVGLVGRQPGEPAPRAGERLVDRVRLGAQFVADKIDLRSVTPM